MHAPSSELARLLSLIAHELRTPLSVTSGYLKMLVSERRDPLTEGQRQAVGGAARACDLLIALAADISLLGRLERGEITPQPSSIDIPVALVELARSHTVSPDHPVDVRLRGSSDRDENDRGGDGDREAIVQADAHQVRRALQAVLAAAVRAAPDDGTVEIDWRVASDPADPAAVVRIGLALPDRLDALLDAGASDLDPVDESQAGLGMALPIASRLVALNGGQVEAARGGPALALRITLPRRAADARAESDRVEADRTGADRAETARAEPDRPRSTRS